MNFHQWKRREFITLLGGAAVSWPLAARAQPPAMPVVGVLGVASPIPSLTSALLEGLKESGFVEGQNLRVEHRWANGVLERLPKLAAELVDLRVTVLVTFGTQAARLIKDVSTKLRCGKPT
jgi:putative ABC transport system substrate-binding protein